MSVEENIYAGLEVIRNRVIRFVGYKMYTWRSSTYIMYLHVRFEPKWITKKINSRGPWTVPWGTALVTGRVLLLTPVMGAYIWCWYRKLAIHDKRFILMQTDINLLMRLRWRNAKTFDKDVNTVYVTLIPRWIREPIWVCQIVQSVTDHICLCITPSSRGVNNLRDSWWGVYDAASR